MKSYKAMSKDELLKEKESLEKEYSDLKSLNLSLNMMRGNPAPNQLAMSNDLFEGLGSKTDFKAKDGTDCRNYGIPAGIPEARELFAEILGTDASNVFIGNSSSLNLMFDTLMRACAFGEVDSEKPWFQVEGRKWLCPVPGYDRHFKVTQQMGFELIPVPMTNEGPDMDVVEELVKEFGEQARTECDGITEELVIYYIAHLELKYKWFICKFGLDPNKANIFLQSDVHAHSELAIILQNYLYMGELSRMTQFKDKSSKMKESAIGLGLFAYPVLMACDIILYNANIVPVGEDQVQHVELCRDLVNRFNNRYGDVLQMPKYEMRKVGARIMSLSDPTVKMSKSDPKGDIFLKDDLKVVRKKIMSAVTDMGCEVKYDQENKPGISNLLTIYAALKDVTIEEAEQHFAGYRYGDFKKEVADVVCDDLGAFQERYRAIIESKEYEEVLREGAKKASVIANETLKKVQKAVGLLKL